MRVHFLLCDYLFPCGAHASTEQQTVAFVGYTVEYYIIIRIINPDTISDLHCITRSTKCITNVNTHRTRRQRIRIGAAFVKIFIFNVRSQCIRIDAVSGPCERDSKKGVWHACGQSAWLCSSVYLRITLSPYRNLELTWTRTCLCIPCVSLCVDDDDDDDEFVECVPTNAKPPRQVRMDAPDRLRISYAIVLSVHLLINYSVRWLWRDHVDNVHRV